MIFGNNLGFKGLGSYEGRCASGGSIVISASANTSNQPCSPTFTREEWKGKEIFHYFCGVCSNCGGGDTPLVIVEACAVRGEQCEVSSAMCVSGLRIKHLTQLAHPHLLWEEKRKGNERKDLPRPNCFCLLPSNRKVGPSWGLTRKEPFLYHNSQSTLHVAKGKERRKLFLR